jgi:hypothetical protein
MNEIEAEASAGRNAAWGVLLEDLQRILRTLGKGLPTYRGQFRMADFAAFAHMVGRTDSSEAEVEAMLAAMLREQSTFAEEQVALHAVIRRWLEANREHLGQELDTRGLYEQLKQFAEDGGVRWPYSSVSVFGKALGNVATLLAPEFTMEDRTGRSDKKFFTFSSALDIESSLDEALDTSVCQNWVGAPTTGAIN